MDFDGTQFIEPIPDMMNHPSDVNGFKKKVKRPLNAYNLFYLEKQPELKSRNPTLNGN